MISPVFHIFGLNPVPFLIRMFVAKILSHVVEEHPWINARFNARRGIFFFSPRPSEEISLESWSRTRKLNPKGNDAIHFDASFQRATPLFRYHFARSREQSSPLLSSFSSSSFSGILFRLTTRPTYSYVALTNVFFSLEEKRGKKRKERGKGYDLKGYERN